MKYGNAERYSTVILLTLFLLLLNVRTLNVCNGSVSFLRHFVNKTPHISRTFQVIIPVESKTIFQNSVILVSIPWLLFFSLGVPRAPITTRTTFAYIFYASFSFLDRSRYLPFFSISLSSTLV